MPETRPSRPLTVDRDGRTARAVLTNGARVSRNGTRPDGTWGPWIEGLSVEGADLSRAAGAPLLVDHVASAENQLGVVESAAREGDRIVATIRFGKGPRADRYFTDVQDGIRASLSIGYEVLRWAKQKAGEVPIFLAEQWRLLEASIVAIPADASAGFRSHELEGLRTMTLETTSPAPEGAPAVATTELPAIGLDQHARMLERRRCTGIFAAAAALGLDRSVAEDFIAREVELDAARSAMVDLMAARQNAIQVRNHQLPRVTGGTSYDDPASVRSRLSDALAHRLSGGLAPLPDAARQFRGLSLLDMGRNLLAARGVRTDELNRHETVDWLLGRDMGGLHSTSDFPLLLTDASNKSLQARFERLRPALTAVARRIEVDDFRAIYRMRLGEMPDLDLVNEHGEFTNGTLSEERETYRVRTYGKIFGFTRQLLVNDDLNAFSDFLNAMGGMAATLLGDKLYEVLSTNAAMADGTALFHTNHGNVATGAGVPSIATLGEARKLMRQQTGVTGRPIQVEPRYLVVGPQNETTAEQVLTAITAATMNDANPFAGKLKLVVEARITGTAWYLFSDPALAPLLEYAELNGSRPMSGPGPRVASREGWRVDGVEFRVVYDVGAGATDWRGAVRNAGA